MQLSLIIQILCDNGQKLDDIKESKHALSAISQNAFYKCNINLCTFLKTINEVSGHVNLFTAIVPAADTYKRTLDALKPEVPLFPPS